MAKTNRPSGAPRLDGRTDTEKLTFAESNAEIAKTESRLAELRAHRETLEVAYKRGTHWPGVVANAFMSDDGVRVAWLSGSRLVNLSGVEADDPSVHENDATRNEGGVSTSAPLGDGRTVGRTDSTRDNRTDGGSRIDGSSRMDAPLSDVGRTDGRVDGRTDDTLHEHRTGEGGVIVKGGVSRTVAATAVDYERTNANYLKHPDARRLTITVGKKAFQHVDETPNGLWVYRHDTN